MDRRNFFAGVAGWFGSLALIGKAEADVVGFESVRATGPIEPRDEAFWQRVRAQFPLTTKRTYLNTGGLGPSPRPVIDAVQQKIEALEEISEAGHSAELWQDIKGSIAAFIGCNSDELTYVRNTTEGANIVCNGLPLKAGDEVITSTHEHVGNTITWLGRQRREGIVVKTFEPSTASAQENIARIEALLTARTRVLSVSHVTCATGQVLPVEALGELAARHKLWYFVDGAQAAGMLPLDLHRINCHAYATSGHKWMLGPKGTGLLYVRRDAQELIEPKFIGAYSASGPVDMVSSGQFEFTESAQRYEYGTVNVPLFVGLGTAVDFLSAIGQENIWRRNRAMAAQLMEGLDELGAQVLSPRQSGEYSGIVTFRLAEMDYPQLQGFLAREFKLRTRGIYEGGLNGLRISLHLFNSFAEVERVLEGVKAAKDA